VRARRRICAIALSLIIAAVLTVNATPNIEQANYRQPPNARADAVNPCRFPRCHFVKVPVGELRDFVGGM
jgi:hypothetical protein